MRSAPRFMHFGLLAFSAALLTTGCDDDSGEDGADGSGDLRLYEFESRFVPGESSVSYSGQTFRQVLIESLKAELSAIQDEIDNEAAVFEPGEVRDRLLFYYQFDPDTSLDVPHALSPSPAALQTTFGDISGGADLTGKIAGNDEVGQHKDWGADLVGWDADSPEDLVLDWIDDIDAMAVAYSSGAVPAGPDGGPISKFYVSPEGLDYQQLLQKFLLGAINFSQGTDDYLDDDTEGKGLLTDNTEPDEDAPYTALEHQWDEGFGYWGGARNYLDYTDDEIAGADGRPDYAAGYHDADADGAIDLKSEFNFSASVNAAKRDRGSAESARTDFSTETMNAFIEGRRIIAEADGALSDEQLDALRAQRDIAVLGWEKAIAATAVHYINDTIQDMNAPEYDFLTHAQHWGELKGFLLTLQFSPHSPLGEGELAQIHADVGTTPVFPQDDEAADYIASLLSVRATLGAAYEFDAANLGDDNGENGW